MHESNPNVESHGDFEGSNLVHTSRNLSLAENVRLENSSNSTYTGRTSPSAQGRLVVCLVHELQQHPSYIRNHLTVSPSQLSVVAAHGDVALQQPIVITRNRWIIDGYARLEFAQRQGLASVLCIEYDLTDEEGLRWLIQSHRHSRSLNSHIGILLALDLEPLLQEKARANQQAGGRNKGSSNLTEAKSFDVRSEIAVEGVDEGIFLEVIQAHREDTNNTAEEFQRRFPVGAWLNILTITEITVKVDDPRLIQ